MKTSKELLKRSGIMPKLRLAERVGKGVRGTGPHKVRLIEDKIIRGKDFDSGNPIEKVRYFVEENGEKKQYDTRLKSKDTDELSYFVQRMAEIPEGSEVVLEFKRAGVRGYIEITVGDTVTRADVDDDSDEELDDALEGEMA